MRKRKNFFGRLKPLSVVLALFILSALFGIFLAIKEYTGFATQSLTSESGSITELNVYQKDQSRGWMGFYGVALMVVGYSSPQDEIATTGGMLEKNLLFSCLPPNTGQSIYASTVPRNNVSLETLRAATVAEVDAYLGFLGTEGDSATRTFTQGTMSVTLNNATIANIPRTYTYQLANPASTVYDLGILIDGSGKIVMATHLAGFDEGFNGRTYNYQMFVPVRNGTSPRYYFWVDPSNTCPGGLGQEISNATIRGFVRDNETLLPIQYVMVSAGGMSAYTDASGYYTYPVPAGSHIIVGQKNGYDTHIGNFSVGNGEVFEYNFTMAKSTDKVGNGTGTGVGPGIGPGVGTGVGSGIGTGTGTGVGPGVGEGTGPGVDVGPDFFPQSLLGIGPGIGPYVEKPKKIEGLTHWVSLKEINARLKIGNFLQDMIYIYRFGNGTADLEISVSDNLKEMVSIDKKKIRVEEGGFENFTVTIYGNKEPGMYVGSLIINGSFNEEFPAKIQISPEDKMQVQSLLMDVSPARESEVKGKVMKFKVNLQNLLINEYYDVFLSYNVSSVDGKSSFILPIDRVRLQTTTSVVKSFEVPEVNTGDYIIKVYASYLGIRSYASAVFTIKERFMMIKIFFFRMWHLIALLSFAGISYGTYKYVKWKIESKKRFHVKVEFNELPKPGTRAGFIGKVAETNIKAFFDLDRLTVHTIVAGSTGGGKSVSAQVIIEEALLKGVAVIVFDPTAQWSGMLRKNVNEKMLALFPQFGMNPKKDPKGFNGNVRTIFDKNELIDLRRYMKPGEIQIFTLNRMDPVDVDVFVANAIKEVFHANFDEAQQLRLLLIFDEVHRLLPKFGGAGQGFLQIERGCREFRKWGLGIMLISQVLADFVGQIKANINTEIQMRTSDEGDLERIKSKYGPEMLQYLVKSPVGTGMLVNPAFNRGKPYFISFRPLIHSIARLSDKELEQYNKYNDIIDDLDDQLAQLEKEGVDIFDLKLELKLALDKVKTGNFNMVSIYLEGLTPQIKKQWEKIGKEPKKKEVKQADESELKAEMEKAKAEREKFEKEQAKAQGGKPPEGAAPPAQAAAAAAPPNALPNIRETIQKAQEEAKTAQASKPQAQEAPKENKAPAKSAADMVSSTQPPNASITSAPKEEAIPVVTSAASKESQIPSQLSSQVSSQESSPAQPSPQIAASSQEPSPVSQIPSEPASAIPAGVAEEVVSAAASPSLAPSAQSAPLAIPQGEGLRTEPVAGLDETPALSAASAASEDAAVPEERKEEVKTAA